MSFAVQRLRLSEDGPVSYTVVGDGLPVEDVEDFLAYLAARGASPNTVQGYAYDLRDFFVQPAPAAPPAPRGNTRHAASEASLHRRLETALERNRQLRDQVTDLTRKLETAHGEIRRLRTLTQPSATSGSRLS